jgi:acetyl-CoA hydrolase
MALEINRLHPAESQHAAASLSTNHHKVSAADFAFQSVLQPGDLICFGQACSEPVGLLRALLRQAESLHASLGRLKLFVAGSYSGMLKTEHGAWFDFLSYGAIGDGATLARAGLLEVYPVHYSQLASLLTDELLVDVVLLQISAANAQGQHSLGVASDYQVAAARRARVVIAEVNARVPFTPNALLPSDVRIDHVVWSDEPLVEVPPSPIDPTSEQVAAQVSSLVPHGATLQMGIGSLMAAICVALRSHRDLGIHSGIMTDGMADLMRQGVVNNARKGTHIGKAVAGSLLGSGKLFEFAHLNPDICLVDGHVTHGVDSLARQTRFCSINSAVEVDLTGQVNAEVANGKYVGAVGGQVDFVRAAAQCDDGLSIIALPSSAARGTVSRIVAKLNGPVTTPRCDVDRVVTEWGIASLRGLSLRQRAIAMAGIAHPDHRQELLRVASQLGL